MTLTGRGYKAESSKSLILFPALQPTSSTLLPELSREPAGKAERWRAESQHLHLKVEDEMVGREMRKNEQIISITPMEGDLVISSKFHVHLSFNFAFPLL